MGLRGVRRREDGYSQSKYLPSTAC